VGRNRRVADGSNTARGRPALGRKGIGKFAGFGIAEIVEIDKISALTGEHSRFRLDIRELRGSTFMETSQKPIELLTYELPDHERRISAGTTVTLRNLKLINRRDPEVFARQMARRFQLAAASDTFQVLINGHMLPDDIDPFEVEFEFPRDYKPEEMPKGVIIDGGWAVESLGDNKIRWRMRFSQQPISDEEFRGIAIFCGIKVAQNLFFFNLSGGLGGQHGQAYLSGTVRADYIDHVERDIITTERQRINWEDPYAEPLLAWGRDRVALLLRLWQARRGEARNTELDARLTGFSERLSNLPPTERETIRTALRRLATVAAIDKDRFSELAEAILTAWEGGRLRGIIENIARMEDMDEGVLISLLAEERVLTALHVAEVIRTKVAIIEGLEARIKSRERENSIRDYIAKSPWLISPRWETYKREISLNIFLEEAQARAGIVEKDPRWAGRMDLVLKSDGHIPVLEFMRPKLSVDGDHLQRFQTYVDTLRVRVKVNTSLGIHTISGLLVADKLATTADDQPLIERLAAADMRCA
jgi:hypothetical protein